MFWSITYKSPRPSRTGDSSQYTHRLRRSLAKDSLHDIPTSRIEGHHHPCRCRKLDFHIRHGIQRVGRCDRQSIRRSCWRTHTFPVKYPPSTTEIREQSRAYDFGIRGHYLRQTISVSECGESVERKEHLLATTIGV